MANALALTVLCLAVHPECQKKLMNEIRAHLETSPLSPYDEVRLHRQAKIDIIHIIYH